MGSPYSTLPSSLAVNTTQFTKIAQIAQPQADVLGKTQSITLENDTDNGAAETGEAENKGADTKEQYILIASSSSASLESENELSEGAAAQNDKSHGRWWCQGRYMILVFCNGLVVAGLVMAQELATLWAILPIARGGPQWSEQTIGKAWVPMGVFLIIVQVLLTSKIITRFGNEPSLKCALLLQILAQSTPPWIALANPAVLPDADTAIEPTALAMGLFLLAVALEQFLSQIISSTLITLVSASVDGKNRARATGLTTAVQSFFQSGSPMLAGSILSTTVDRTGILSADPVASFPGGTHPAFFCKQSHAFDSVTIGEVVSSQGQMILHKSW